MKFKVGDEVIVVRASFDNELELGWKGRVVSIEKSATIDLVVEVASQKLPNIYGYKNDDVELVSVYNSPLYSALK